MSFLARLLKQMKSIFVLIILIITTTVMSSCAYNLSTNLETLPGNVRRIQIPLFKNATVELGVEVFLRIL